MRKVEKRKTKRKRKGRQSTKLKINVKRFIKQLLSANEMDEVYTVFYF